MTQTTVDPVAFRAAMSRFPAGVTIVTTTDAAGVPWGFTATSFCSLSLDPPLVLVCLARSARCFEAFNDASGYVIHFAESRHQELAMRFASRSVEDKFAGTSFAVGPHGHHELEDAIVALRCTAENVVPGGDHVILIGRVQAVELRDDGEALLHADRTFRRLAPHSDG